MNVFGFHICPDEIAVLQLVWPQIEMSIFKVRFYLGI